MDRELVLVVLVVLFVGITVPVGAVLAALIEPKDDALRPGTELERVATRRLLLPVLPVAMALSALLGWALVEPDDSERVPWLAFALAAPVLLVWSRAAVRAARALAPRRVRTAATVGIFSPRVVIGEDFAAHVDEDALRAAVAHEKAHATHRDPLRIWLAQIVTDLQWPLPGVKVRFDRWLAAVELARDDEARREVDGADLAAAVIAAARLERPARFAFAGIASADVALRLRVERLLAPIPEAPVEGPRRRTKVALLLLAIAGPSLLGVGFGEALVRQVLGWGH